MCYTSRQILRTDSKPDYISSILISVEEEEEEGDTNDR